MKPSDVYPSKLAEKIRDTGDCWLWLGELPSPPRRQVPMGRINDNYSTLVGHGVRRLGEEVVKSETLVMSCENDLCVHPEHACGTNSDVGRLLYIKNHVEYRGNCQVWTGPKVLRTPRMPRRVWTEGGPEQEMVSVRHFIWCVEHIPDGFPWPKTAFYRASCGTDLCVAFKHIEQTKERADA